MTEFSIHPPHASRQSREREERFTGRREDGKIRKVFGWIESRPLPPTSNRDEWPPTNRALPKTFSRLPVFPSSCALSNRPTNDRVLDSPSARVRVQSREREREREREERFTGRREDGKIRKVFGWIESRPLPPPTSNRDEWPPTNRALPKTFSRLPVFPSSCALSNRPTNDRVLDSPSARVAPKPRERREIHRKTGRREDRRKVFRVD